MLQDFGFNPCFNGTMYKTICTSHILVVARSFNPCFNGTMYKTISVLKTYWSDFEFQSLF